MHDVYRRRTGRYRGAVVSIVTVYQYHVMDGVIIVCIGVCVSVCASQSASNVVHSSTLFISVNVEMCHDSLY